MALFQVIKYTGPAHMLVWRYPKTDMSTGSRLVVGPTQTAVFVRGGVICDVLGPGSYTLSTANLPILSALVKLPFGGKSPFTAEVFFINKLDVLDVKWGTARHIQLQDPVCRVVIPLRAFGQYGVRIMDSHRFLERRRLPGVCHPRLGGLLPGNLKQPHCRGTLPLLAGKRNLFFRGQRPSL